MQRSQFHISIMSANLDSDLMSCSSCVATKEAELEYFETIQDKIYNNIQNLEVLIEEHDCVDEFLCRHCGDVHLEILRQHVKLHDNKEYEITQVFLCEIHKNNIHGLAQLEEEDVVPYVFTGCVDACPVHCDNWD